MPTVSFPNRARISLTPVQPVWGMESKTLRVVAEFYFFSSFPHGLNSFLDHTYMVFAMWGRC